MSTIDDKLRRGFVLIARANDDSDLLGVALLAVHGALEQHLRARLLALPNLRADDRALLLDREQLDSPALLALVDLYLDLGEAQRRTVHEGARICRAFAEGLPFAGRTGDMLRYGRFVELLCERAGLLEQVLAEQRAARPSEPPPPPPPPPKPAPQPVAGQQYDVPPRRAAPPFGALLLIVAGLVICMGGWVVAERLELPQVLNALAGASSAVSSTPVAPLLPSPTPTLRARVVGIGDGPGWLHRAPTFTSGTLPIPLVEGVRVTVLDGSQTDANGVTWRYVTVGGYEGWCPQANLDMD